jgi:glycosyltransferase involved in cell wall biosynthesis
MRPSYFPGTVNQQYTLAETARQYEVLMFSNVKWDSDLQRQQHIVSHFSPRTNVLFVEEPGRFVPGEPPARLIGVRGNVTVLRPNIRSIDDLPELILRLVDDPARSAGWFYSPSFIPVLERISFRRIIYDCVEDIPAGDTIRLYLSEKRLLAKSDIVFTASKSLYEEKKHLNDNIHYFPGLPDVSHFKKARQPLQLPPDIAALKRPVVGFSGVIDNRIDLNLVDEVAKLLPEASFVFLGPLVNLGKGMLPKARNFHYMGMRSYAELPAYLRAFDVAMLPYALNDATKHIGPSKALEYMAANRPIVTTGIFNMVSDYSHCVNIVFTPKEFAKSIKLILSRPEGSDCRDHFDELLDRASWEKTAARMEEMLYL